MCHLGQKKRNKSMKWRIKILILIIFVSCSLVGFYKHTVTKSIFDSINPIIGLP